MKSFMNKFFLALGFFVSFLGSSWAIPNRAYVSNYYDGTVTLIDSSSNTVIATIPVGLGPDTIGITPDGTRAYILNYNSDSISVIINQTVVATLTGFTAPYGIVFLPNGQRAYVANNLVNDTVSVLDTNPNSPTYNQIISTISDPSFDGPGVEGITPDGTKIYVPNQNVNTVSVINTLNNSVSVVSDPMSTITSPFQVVVAPNGINAYVSNYGSFDVSIINVATNTATGSVTLPIMQYFLAISPDNSKIYVTGYTSNVYVIHTTLGNTVTTVNDPMSVFIFAAGMAFSPDGTKAYVSDNSGFVAIVDVATDTVIGTIAAGSGADFVAFTPTVLPPSGFSGAVINNAFLTQIDRIHKLFWTASADPTVVAYRIYRNSVLIAVVPASDPLIYLDHNQSKKVAVTYSITAVNRGGAESVVQSIVLQ